MTSPAASLHHPARRGIHWWTDALFMVGSACFALAALPGASSAVSAKAIGLTFFVGSIFFTSAATLQFVQVSHERGSLDWWASLVQLVGTVWFNINTFNAMKTGWTAQQEDLRIWTPDFVGSICFLVASGLAVRAVRTGGLGSRHDRSRPWWVATINMTGSVLFMAAALAAFVRPDTGNLLDASLANSGTCLGGVCFFWAARLEITQSG